MVEIGKLYIESKCFVTLEWVLLFKFFNKIHNTFEIWFTVSKKHFYMFQMSTR